MVDQTLLWPHRPNWNGPVTETLSFRTEIISASRRGREQRVALRQNPRRKFEYRIDRTGADQRLRNAIFDTRQPIETLIVDPIRYSHPREGVPPFTKRHITAGDTGFFLGFNSDGTGYPDTPTGIPPWVVAGEYLALYYGGAFELVQVLGLGAAVSLTSPVLADWPVGVRVYRVARVKIEESISQRLLTHGVGASSFEFDEYVKTSFNLAGGADLRAYKAREVFDFPLNWGESIQLAHGFGTEIVDFSNGPFEVFAPQLFSTRTLRFSLTAVGQAGVQNVEKFFRRRKGRLQEFYCPTFSNDLIAAAPIAAASTQILALGSEAATYYNGDPVFASIQIRLVDGTLYENDIVSIVASGGDSLITVANAWPANVDPAVISRISFLPVVRFGSDDLEIEWRTDQIAQITMSLVSLENLALQVPS